MRANVIELRGSAGVVEVSVREHDNRLAPPPSLRDRRFPNCCLQARDTQAGVDYEISILALSPPDVASDKLVCVRFVDLNEAGRDIPHPKPV